MKWLNKADNAIYTATKSISIFMFIIMVALCILQVVCRYLLQISISFSEELARFLFIWITFLGTAMALKRNQHVKMELLVKKFPKKISDIINFIIFLISLLAYGIMVYSGILVMGKTMTQTSAALGLPMSYVYLAVPVCGILMIAFEWVAQLRRMFQKERRLLSDCCSFISSFGYCYRFWITY